MPAQAMTPIRRALISVSDKSGLADRRMQLPLGALFWVELLRVRDRPGDVGSGVQQTYTLLWRTDARGNPPGNRPQMRVAHGTMLGIVGLCGNRCRA